MSWRKLIAAIDPPLVDALAELPEHELEGWQRGNRLGLRIVCQLAGAIRLGAGDGAGSAQVGLSVGLHPHAGVHALMTRAARCGSVAMDEIVYWFYVWAALVVLTVGVAWATDRPVTTFVALAIFCTPIVSLVMLTALWLKASATRRGR